MKNFLKFCILLVITFLVSTYAGTWLSYYLFTWQGICSAFDPAIGYIIFLIWIILIGLLIVIP